MAIGQLSARSLAYVRRKVQIQMRDTVTITRPSLATLDTSTGQLSSQTSGTIYTGQARIRPSSGPKDMLLGDEILTYRWTTISIPYNATVPRRDDLVTVNTSYIDQALRTRVFRIMDVTGGGTQACITLTCSNVEPSSTFPPADAIPDQ